MKKRLLHLALVSLPLVVVMGEEVNAQGSGSNITCDASVVPTPAAAATVVVTGVTNQRINVCGWMTSAGATASGTIQLGWSTIAAVCTTNVTTLTHSMDVNAAGWSNKDSPVAVISTPLSMSLCATPSSTAIKYMIFFSQD